MAEQKYSKWTVEGDKKTRWMCGCFQTADNFFKFCERHEQTLQKAIRAQVDELDMTIVVDDDPRAGQGTLEDQDGDERRDEHDGNRV